MVRPKRPTLLCAALALLIAGLLAGCNLLGGPPTPTRAVDPNTPEGAALSYAAAGARDPNAAATSFVPIHIWEMDGERLVAFSYASGYQEAWSVCNGQARVSAPGGVWRVTEAGAHCWDQGSVTAITGLYSTVTDGDGATQTVIYGDVLLPEVTAVSIEFVVGGANAVAEIGEAGYWLALPGEQPPIRAVAIDANGNLVALYEFGAPLSVTPVAAP